MINKDKKFCYRICHISNLPRILQTGLCTKHHPDADPNFISIGNPDIINTRDEKHVKIDGYGTIGEYVPFYFTPRSIMQYNIVTGIYHPVVPKREKEDILVIRCLVRELIKCGRYFFTDGQANDSGSGHYTALENSNLIDWKCIQNSNFKKSDGDTDRPRRYQAEFLVYNHVPISFVESFNVYNNKAAKFVLEELERAHISEIPVHINNTYYF